MATMIQAVTRYRPRLVHNGTVGVDQLARRMARGSLASESVVRHVLSDLEEQVIHALQLGESARLPGLGRFSMELTRNGVLRPYVRTDVKLRRTLASLDRYHGKILQRENIGLSAADMVALWNAEHPEDPIVDGPGARRAA